MQYHIYRKEQLIYTIHFDIWIDIKKLGTTLNISIYILLK